MRSHLISIAIVVVATLSAAQSQRPLNLVPIPSSLQPGTGALAINQSFSVTIAGFQDPRLKRGVQRFMSDLSRQTGMLLKQDLAPSSSPTLLIHADHASEEVQRSDEDESYELIVGESNAKLSAANPLGIFHGLQTFLQL